MQEMKIEELESMNVLLIGSEEERSRYYPAIIGMTKDRKKVVYSLDRLVGCFSKGSSSTAGTRTMMQ